MRRFSIILALVLVVSGCAATGPTFSLDFPTLVAKTIPKEDGGIYFFGSGKWFPSVRGFTDLRMLAPVDPTPGVLVITNEALIFQQWDGEEKIYGVIKRIPYAEFAAVSLDNFGFNRRLVVRKRDLSYDSFDFRSETTGVVDAAKVEHAFEFLRVRIKSQAS
jgi:hypothetical protein